MGVWLFQISAAMIGIGLLLFWSRLLFSQETGENVSDVGKFFVGAAVLVMILAVISALIELVVPF